MTIAGYQRYLLEIARERAYLDTGRLPLNQLEMEYGRWCWKLRQPMVVLTRQSFYSRYCILKLDLCGTPNLLNKAGQARIKAIVEEAGGRAKTPPNEVGGVWTHLPRAVASKVAREAFKVATTLGYYQPDFVLYEKREKEYEHKLGLRTEDKIARAAKA